MGCCIGLRNDSLLNKDMIIEINESERREIIVKSSKSSFDTEKNCNKFNKQKSSVISTKIAETSFVDNAKSPKKSEKIVGIYNKRIKETAQILQLDAKSEVKNIHKFFVLN